ncbi:MAG: UvrD-helicase domain-containing protein [Candidatus Gracilibacteria bacterium]|nr:UvrD-helicase domain-containing protein [Candidatus Gracilibacteria bacterium]
MQLNPKQEEAKNKIEGPLLIIAGAGSGKTATLTQRVNYMISEKSIPASQIMMVTFTNKAAREMKERVSKRIGVEAPRGMYQKGNFPLIGTFHSICIFMLKDVLNTYNSEELNIGLQKDFVIYDESDKLSVLKGIIKNELLLDEKEYPARQVAFYISNAKNSLISARSYESEVDSALKEVVYKVYLKYEQNLASNNAMDFDDILVKALACLKNPKILHNYQERYKYLMVDEYQDTNAPQYHIIKLLAERYKNLAVVGDDAQSIYSWRGADMTNIINFRRDYPEALIVKLEQNYRSTKMIIQAANNVIAKNTSGIKKELWTDNNEGEKIEYIEAPDDKTEASIIAGIIKDKSEEGSYAENVILYRTNAQSRQIEEALMMKGIPYRVIGGQKFYDRKEIKDLLGYLRVIHNGNDVVNMKRIINTPTRKIGAKSIEILDKYKNSFELNYPMLIENIDEIEELKPAARKAIILFGSIYSNLKHASTQLCVAELIVAIRKEVLYDEYICEGLSEDEKQAKKENMDELITVASQYNGLEPRDSLSQFLEEVALITDMDTKDEREEYVTLMTIHTSKGLEYNRVFLTGMEDGIFPSFRSSGDVNALEEERRLMYVAMTRAEKELYISRAKERFVFGDYARNPESRFMKEIPAETMLPYDMSDFVGNTTQLFSKTLQSSDNGGSFSFGSAGSTTQSAGVKIKPKANNNVADFARGDKVSHPKFGGGIITSLNGELAEIAFSGKGIKKMNIKIAPVRKEN